jgi:hypothetical protein
MNSITEASAEYECLNCFRMISLCGCSKREIGFAYQALLLIQADHWWYHEGRQKIEKWAEENE